MNQKQSILYELIKRLNHESGAPVPINVVKQQAKRERVRTEDVIVLLQELQSLNVLTFDGDTVTLHDRLTTDNQALSSGITSQPDLEDGIGEADVQTPYSTEEPVTARVESSGQEVDTGTVDGPDAESSAIGTSEHENRPEDTTSSYPVQPSPAEQLSPEKKDVPHIATGDNPPSSKPKRSFSPPNRRTFQSTGDESGLENLDMNQINRAKSIDELLKERDTTLLADPTPLKASSSKRTDTELPDTSEGSQITDSETLRPGKRFFKPDDQKHNQEADLEQSSDEDTENDSPSLPANRSFFGRLPQTKETSERNDNPPHSRSLFATNRRFGSAIERSGSPVEDLDRGVQRKFGPGIDRTPEALRSSAAGTSERVIASYDIDLPIHADDMWVNNVARTIRKLNENTQIHTSQDVVVLRVSLEIPVSMSDAELAAVTSHIDTLVSLAELPPQHTRVEWKTRLIE